MKTIKLFIITGITVLLASNIAIAQSLNSEWSYQTVANNIEGIAMIENHENLSPNLGLSITDTLPIFKTDLGLFAYPNPTSDILHLDKGENDMLYIRVFSSDGKALFSVRTRDQITELDFSQYARAYYILNVSNGKYSNTLKICKK